MDPDAPPARRRRRGRDVLPVDDRQRHRGAQVAGAVPAVDRLRDVAPDDQEQFGPARRIVPAQRLDGVDRVGRAVPVDLEPRDLEARDAVDRGRDHREPVRRARPDPTPLLPRVSGDDDEDPVEIELVASCGRRGEVRDVDGVEGAAEDAEALHRTSVGDGTVNSLCTPSLGEPGLCKRCVAGGVGRTPAP